MKQKLSKDAVNELIYGNNATPAPPTPCDRFMKPDCLKYK